MMQVMKLADRGDSGQRHLQKREARDLVNLVRRKVSRGGVHLFAPRPKAVGRVLGAILGATADDALKCMRVRVDQTRQHRTSGKTLRVSDVFRELDNLPTAIGDEREAGAKPPTGVDVIW